jgi:hypothetical protein
MAQRTNDDSEKRERIRGQKERKTRGIQNSEDRDMSLRT